MGVTAVLLVFIAMTLLYRIAAVGDSMKSSIYKARKQVYSNCSAPKEQMYRYRFPDTRYRLA